MTRARQNRAEVTRRRILDATVEVLHDAGFAGTSTQAVCRRVGCSRGTLLYHFPTREDLLVSALHHVLASRVEQFVASAIGPMEPEAFVLALWDRWKDEAFTAWLELAVAARTHDGLQAPLQQTMQVFDQMIVDAFRKLVPHDHLPEELVDAMPQLLFAVFNGLAVSRSYEHDEALEPYVTQIARFAGAVIPGPVGGTPWKS